MTDDETLRASAQAAHLPRLVVLEVDEYIRPGEIRYYVSACGEIPALDPLVSYAGLGIWTHEGVTTKPAAEYIAAACNAVPRLLDEAERLRRGWDQMTALAASREVELMELRARLTQNEVEHRRNVMHKTAALDSVRRRHDALQQKLERAAAVIALASKVASGELNAAPNVVRAFVDALDAYKTAGDGSVR